MRVYSGVRLSSGSCRVYVEVAGQNPRKRLRHRTAGGHSPTGFEWGYAGSGPAELARAIVKDVTGEDEPNPRVYQQFKARVVQHLTDGWVLTEDEVKRVLAEIDQEIEQRDGAAAQA